MICGCSHTAHIRNTCRSASGKTRVSLGSSDADGDAIGSNHMRIRGTIDYIKHIQSHVFLDMGLRKTRRLTALRICLTTTRISLVIAPSGKARHMACRSKSGIIMTDVSVMLEMWEERTAALNHRAMVCVSTGKTCNAGRILREKRSPCWDFPILSLTSSVPSNLNLRFNG